MKILYAVIILGLLSLGVFLVQSGMFKQGGVADESALSAVPATGVIHTVVLTSEGYRPDTLTIKRGDAITFSTEDSDMPFWPASNLHPTHRIYSDFDPKEPIPPEETWSFVFGEVGEWEFHDHLRPYFTGTITVEE